MIYWKDVCGVCDGVRISREDSGEEEVVLYEECDHNGVIGSYHMIDTKEAVFVFNERKED